MLPNGLVRTTIVLVPVLVARLGAPSLAGEGTPSVREFRLAIVLEHLAQMRTLVAQAVGSESREEGEAQSLEAMRSVLKPEPSEKGVERYQIEQPKLVFITYIKQQ